jgi:hypothetical protein
MKLLDTLREQANQFDQSAKEAGKAASAKLDQAEATLRTHGLLHELGVAVYAARSGKSRSGNSVEINRLVAKIAKLKGERVPASKVTAKTPAKRTQAQKTPAKTPKKV